jgi:hypothetical protein
LGAIAVCCVLAVTLATRLSAQATQTKETVAAGAAKVSTAEIKGEVVVTGTNWLIAKTQTGAYRLYDVKPGRTFHIDGAPKSLAQLQAGTQLTAKVTTTETPMVTRTTKITHGKVFWASPTSIIVTLENGENKQYEVPTDFKFDVDGKQLSAMELKQGMNLTATRIIEEPKSVITQDTVITGTAPKQ